MFWVMLIKPFVALALFTAAWAIARSMRSAIPDGRVKTLFYDRTLQRRHPWKFFFAGACGIWGAIITVALVLGLVSRL
jgi:hypothetical protein